jgi:DNA adenine methylase
MAYVGGKSRAARYIIPLLNNDAFNNAKFYEPFLGYAHILSQVVKKESYNATDVNENLLAIHRFVQSGRTDFPFISKEDYIQLRDGTYIVPAGSKYDLETLRGFAAFAYTYAGKEFGGYTATDKNNERDYAKERFRHYETLQKSPSYMSAFIKKESYEMLDPVPFSVIYADPPYAPFYSETDDYYNVDFDHKKFWETVRRWVRKYKCFVFVSEYSAPPDFVAMRSWGSRSTLNQATMKGTRVEHLFVFQEQYAFFKLLQFDPLAPPRVEYITPDVLMTLPFNKMLAVLDQTRNMPLIHTYLKVITHGTFYDTVIMNAFALKRDSFRQDPAFPFLLTRAKLSPTDAELNGILGAIEYPNLARDVMHIAWTLATGTKDPELNELALFLLDRPAIAVLIERHVQPFRRFAPIFAKFGEANMLGSLFQEIEKSELSYIQGADSPANSNGFVPLPLALAMPSLQPCSLFYDRGVYEKIRTATMGDLELKVAAEGEEISLDMSLFKDREQLFGQQMAWQRLRAIDPLVFAFELPDLQGYTNRQSATLFVEVDVYLRLQDALEALRKTGVTDEQRARLSASLEYYKFKVLAITQEEIKGLPAPVQKKNKRKRGPANVD